MSIGGRSKVATSTLRRRNPGSAAAAVSTSFLETFTGSNGNLGTVTTDLVWDVQSGNVPVVASNKCTTGTAPSTGIARSTDNMSTQDQFAQCDWLTANINDAVTIFLREGVEGGSNLNADEKLYMFLVYDGANTEVSLQDWQTNDDLAGGSVTVGSAIATWRMEVQGNDVRGYRNGVLVISGDATGYAPAGTRAGFELDASSGEPIIDDFEFGDL